ncbi:hypothetical protein MNBD_GAMMA11-2907 [hydrothermal vent metagenome]|uniref:2'-5' RNA ligase n=1 Tax=hydrothermal vent metagenome TaxID=652676 RepID=A0A3B0XTR5_9ZZZZ
MLTANTVQQVKSRRVFLALWPDDRVRRQLVDTFAASPQAHFQGCIFKSSNLHLTLHFLGNLALHQLDCTHGVASKVRLPAFDLRLNCYGYFRQPKVFWIGPDRVPEGLRKLHTELAKKLANCDYQAEKRAFTPHVTLMRKLISAEQFIAPEAINWHVDRFALVESRPGKEMVEYRPLEFYKLA